MEKIKITISSMMTSTHISKKTMQLHITDEALNAMLSNMLQGINIGMNMAEMGFALSNLQINRNAAELTFYGQINAFT